MRYQQQTITPEIAAEMLTHNYRNRLINKKRVATLAADMKSGNWTESPNPICFDTDGNLIDGQHRLSAVVLSGCPVVMTVAYDVPNISVIDKGLERSTGESLYMRGIIPHDLSGRNTIAAVNRYMAIASGGNHPSDNEKGKFIQENAESIKVVMQVVNAGGMNRLCRRAGIQAGLLAAPMCGVPQAELSRFASVVNTGFMESQDESAAIVLRNYTMTNKMAGASDANDLAAYTQMAIRDFVCKTPRKIMYKRKNHVYINPRSEATQ